MNDLPTSRLHLAGEYLATARRVVSVTMFVSNSQEAPPQIRAVLPGDADLVALLDHIGLPGSPEEPIDLTGDQRDVLERAVYAILVLSLDDFERAIFAALSPVTDSPGVDAGSIRAITSVLDLAAQVQGSARSRRSDAAGPGADQATTPALGALADAIMLPVWVADADFVLTWANQAFCDVLGTTLEDVRGSSYVHWTDPDDVARARRIMDHATLEQRNYSLELGIGSGRNEYSRFLMMVAPRQSASGELIGWAGMCFDVSANPAITSRLDNVSTYAAVTGARLHLLIDQLPGIVWTVDRSLRITSFIAGTTTQMGVEPGAAVGKTMSEFFATTDPNYPPIRAALGALAGETGRYRNAFLGRSTQAVVEPLRNPAGEVVGAIGITIDITDTVARERRDARLVRQLELAQTLGRLGSWEIDLTTGEGLWSDEGYRVLGLEPGSVAPTFESFIAQVHPDDRARMRLLNVDGMATGIGYTTEYRAVWPNGELRRVRAAVEFDKGPDGRVTRIYGILQDVTPDPGQTSTPADDARAREHAG